MRQRQNRKPICEGEAKPTKDILYWTYVADGVYVELRNNTVRLGTEWGNGNNEISLRPTELAVFLCWLKRLEVQSSAAAKTFMDEVLREFNKETSTK